MCKETQCVVIMEFYTYCKFSNEITTAPMKNNDI